jgi:hypothetical protein
MGKMNIKIMNNNPDRESINVSLVREVVSFCLSTSQGGNHGFKNYYSKESIAAKGRTG